MYGYVYLTTNLVNGKRYVGKKKSEKFLLAYLGSGKLISAAIKKYGFDSFSVALLEEATSRDQLNTLEKEWIARLGAKTTAGFYNISSGGDGGDPGSYIDEPDARSDWYTQRASTRWTPEKKAAWSEYAKARYNEGKFRPPKGNAGNRDFRHSDDAKARMSASLMETRRRLVEEGRSYHSAESMAIAREKKIAFYTDEVRAQHAVKVRAGHETKREVDPECYVRAWFHDPSDPTNRKRFRPTEAVPEGWVRGKGATGPSKVDLVALHALIGDGLRNSEIARRLSCDPTTVSYYRKKRP